MIYDVWMQYTVCFDRPVIHYKDVKFFPEDDGKKMK